MPELPDVEVFRRYVGSTAMQRRIEHAHVPDSRLLTASAGTVRGHLKGRRLSDSRRHGKLLFLGLDSGRWLLLHFGMTGRPVVWERDDREPDFVLLRLDLDDGRHLAYCAPRKLGEIGIADDPDEVVDGRDLGPDALALDLDGFREALSGRRGMVKPTLMNQEVIAGLGNVWTDEILFHARLHPRVPIPDLDADAERRLFRAMRRVLEESIGFGARPERAPGHYLLGYREEGADCPGRCGGTVERIAVSGRAGYCCPVCQTPPD
ncbi:MAG TPA: DNA-formamidopyrimidine glycosylase family protein [Candidatus Sulfomarinibacteraceae bacterium]|nr:DNA-formamidopyrimidine glycosylase family protein [Candidatus Sulfomarinibacteraceae bacterium]